MELTQSRIVTEDVEGLAAFYATLLRADVPLNGYYVEVPAGPVTVGFSKRRFTEYSQAEAARCTGRRSPGGEIVLDFCVDDLDAEHERIKALGVTWVMRPTWQPWGSRAMTFADADGNLVNVFSPSPGHSCSLPRA